MIPSVRARLGRPGRSSMDGSTRSVAAVSDAELVEPAWAPDDLGATLTAWYRMDRLVGVSDGLRVPTIVGTTGTGAAAPSLSQGTTNKQARFVASAAAFAGEPVLRFSTAEADSYIGDGALGSKTDNYVLAVVYKASDLPSEGVVVLGNLDDAGPGLGIATGTPDSPQYLGVLRGGAGWDASTTLPGLDLRIVVVRRASGSTHLWLNGGAKLLNLTSDPGAASHTMLGTHWLDNSLAHFEGDVAEALIFDSALSDPNLDLLGTYLAERYGGSWAPVS